MTSLLLFCVLALEPKLEIHQSTPLDFHVNPAEIAALLVTDDRIFVTVMLDARIHVFDRSGSALPTIGVKGKGPGEFLYPEALAFDARHLYVSDGGNRSIYKIDPSLGTVVDQWQSSTANNLIVRNGKAYLAYNIPSYFGEPQGTAIMASVLLKENLTPEHFYFLDPCCLNIPGTKYSGILLDSRGYFWAAYTGDYRLEKYSSDGSMVKRITRKPPDFAAPKKSSETMPTRGAPSQHFMSFDKVKGLFEVNDMLVLYRFKVRTNARLDVYDLEGNPVRLGIDISGVTPSSTHDGELYGVRQAPEDNEHDAEIVTIKLVR